MALVTARSRSLSYFFFATGFFSVFTFAAPAFFGPQQAMGSSPEVGATLCRADGEFYHG